MPNLITGTFEKATALFLTRIGADTQTPSLTRKDHFTAVQGTPRKGLHPSLRLLRSWARGYNAYNPRWMIKPHQGIRLHYCDLSAAFIEENGLDVVHSRHDEWFRHMPPLTPGRHDHMAGEWASATMRAAFAAVNEQIPDDELRQLTDVAIGFSSWVSAQKAVLEPKRAPAFFVSGTVGMPLNRLMADHVRRAGGKVYVTDHGSGVGMWESDFRTHFEFDWADVFVTFGPAMAEGAAAADENAHRLQPDNQPTIAWAAATRAPQPPRIAATVACDVVQISAPHIGDLATLWPWHSNEVMFSWQERLHAFLSDHGYSSAIKLHPEAHHPKAMDIATRQGVTPLTEKFENIAWHNQVMIFDGSTTVLRDALRLELPIVFITTPRVRFLPKARAILEQRIAIVDGWTDSDGDIQVDWPELEIAIRRAPSLVQNRAALDGFFPIKS
jgi:hypothetical protein